MDINVLFSCQAGVTLLWVFRVAVHTRVLDGLHGCPARDVEVRLESQKDNVWMVVEACRTDPQGSIHHCADRPECLSPGAYRLAVDSAGYFGLQGIRSFFQEATIAFRLTDPDEPHTIMLVLVPSGAGAFHLNL